MSDIDKYARLDHKAEPNFIEPKGFVLVGNARDHFTLDNMPKHHEVMDFAKELSEAMEFEIIDERRASFVALLGDGSTDPKLGNPMPFEVAEEKSDQPPADEY